MDKELKEIQEKMMDIFLGKDTSNFEKNREEMILTANRKARNCKRVFICIDENGVLVNGSTITLLGGLSSLVDSLVRNGVSKELIEDAVKIGLKQQERTKKDKYDSLEKLMKIMMEELN